MMSVVEAAADVTPSYSRDTAESGGEMTRAKLEDLISEEEEEEEEEEDDPKSVAASTESSSIGQPDDDDDDDDDDEVQSSLSSLASLDDSLPIKRRGLSKFYGGKSKSFGNIGEVRNVKELGKAENPFNKRRRTLMAYNLMFQTKEDNIYNKNKSAPAAGGNGKGNGKSKGKGGSFYSHSNHISMPLLPLAEDEDEDDVKDDSSDADDYRAISRLQQIKEQPYPSLYKPTPTSTSPVNNNSNNNCILHVSDHSHSHSHSHSQLVSHT